jgi:uncharacterized coiled-coil DUF342 family protein
MAQFSGAQGKGAMKERRRIKRLEAEKRQQDAILSVHPDGKCDCKNGHTTAALKERKIELLERARNGETLTTEEQSVIGTWRFQ